MNKFLTVVVPVYKIKEQYLRKCIESLLEQNRHDYKIILVDDGSPDNCGMICDEYASLDIRIEVIHQENQGVSVARNTGMDRADTEWISFIDADDWVENDYIDTLYHVLSTSAKDADILMFDYVREYKSSQSFESLNLREGYLFEENLEMCRLATFYKLIQNGKLNPYSVISLMTKVYRRNFLRSKEIRYIPEAKKGQDRLFNAEAINSTAQIYYMPKLLFHYRCWEESRTHRYDPNIMALTEIELKGLDDVLKKHQIENKAEDYFICRICTRLYSCMRLYYFHPQNPDTISQQIASVKKLVKSPPYSLALQKVKMPLLSKQEKVFVFCLKHNLYNLCRILVRLKSSIFSKKLA